MKKFFNGLQKYLKASDNGLVFACVLCSVISCIMLWSIAKNGLIDRCDFGTVRTQAVASGIGLGIIAVLSVIDYNKIIRLWWIYAFKTHKLLA